MSPAPPHGRSCMRTVYAFEIVSCDGYHTDAEGSLDWLPSDPELMEYSRGQGEHIDTIVMGRRTFEMMAAYWPTPAGIADDPVVAAFMNDLPKVVASRTLSEHAWGPTTFVAEDVAGHVARLKAGPGRDVAVFGSSTLAGHLLAAGLIDELRVAVAPGGVGAGPRLCAGTPAPVPLERVGARAMGASMFLTYRPASVA
jgi:dihydrofolate reductase